MTQPVNLENELVFFKMFHESSCNQSTVRFEFHRFLVHSFAAFWKKDLQEILVTSSSDVTRGP